jgi:NAD(P)-dependent dehydrogenase (short-subunit alcohol dehydrogenase family)
VRLHRITWSDLPTMQQIAPAELPIIEPRGGALAHSRGSKWCRDPQGQYASEFVQLSSMRTIVAAADVGNMIRFLASDAAARISGEAIAVDGDLYYET